MINPDSPVPLYYQIAQAIRQRMEQGELIQGDHLESLRDAAEYWEVNFHTVRHAYTELARAGLVEMRGARGTRVIASLNEPQPSHNTNAETIAGLDKFIRQVIDQSESRFGLNIETLVRKIVSIQSVESERIYVLECSDYQCEDLGRQIEEVWAVEALPHCLESADQLPDGHLVATYFHYNEIRLRWPKKLSSVSFLSIAPGELLSHVVGDKLTSPGTLTICERDEPTAQAVIADVSTILMEDRYTFRSHIVKRSGELPDVSENEILLLPPRIWSGLTGDQKKCSFHVEIRYCFDEAELHQLGATYAWPRVMPEQKQAIV